ncbi:VCBS repeat-containing protein [Lentzea sp. BCCO 10_0856]|uniref:VCBS repeat-containing protein n=1 Tax=Lentzea miocenica TaxID=3095431 RepID=A0ABU4SV30_9PSEU|nr:VCBS repeat-containing protein [Lentzea sp. BCCO 10_0856]MDX8029763.1 VCBS repeat-containing protein [Lentzea sp. BCCO 10_0856]
MRTAAKRLVLGLATVALVTSSTTALQPVASAAECPIPLPPRDLNVTKKVYEVGKRYLVSPKVMLAGFETGWVESHMNNLDCGDRDSLGVFQQRPSQGWGTPEQIRNVDYAATQFFTRAVNVDRANPGYTAGQIAQAVQISGHPERYDQFEATARQLLAEVATTSGRGDRIGDVSGDGYADLTALKSDGTLHYFPNNINSNPGGKPFTSSSQIGVGFGPFQWVRSGDVSGDGFADLIGVQTDGSLHYFPNNINTNPGGRPYTNGINIGSGFQVFNNILLADVSGDGYADLLATKSDGTLHYFPNNINSNPGGRPYTTSTEIGVGFQSFTMLRAGDVSGDGYADLIGIQGDGSLHYLPNNINSNPGGRPYGDSINIGGGFLPFNEIITGDLSGDGYADLMARKPDGTLHYFPNNINSNAGGRPYTTSTQIGVGFTMFSAVV